MAKIVKPPRLRPGDLIGVVGPASPMKMDLLEAGVRYLEGLGYGVKIGRYVHKQRGYLAGTDTQRARDLNNMFRDSRVRAIFCARGGYGTPRLIPHLDYAAIRRNPKIFVGYSDITALQLAILRHADLATFSGPMVAAEMGKGIDPFTEECFWRLITEPKAFGALNGPDDRNLKTVSRGKVSGRLIGGCLSLIATIVGTPHMPAVRHSIFFVEEIGETIYRLDRYFVQLRETGVFQRIAGFILGQTLEVEPAGDEPSLTMDDLVRDFITPLKIPAILNLEYGHGKVKVTMPIGIRAELEVFPRRRRLAIVEPAVA